MNGNRPNTRKGQGSHSRRTVTCKQSTVVERLTRGVLTVALALSATFAQAGDVLLTDDAEVRANTPNARLGGRNSLAVREAILHRSLLQFDLSGYSGPILNATLTLPITDVFRAGDFEVRRLLSDWDEATVNFNNQPAISSQLGAMKSVVATDANRLIDVDVTALVQALIDDPENDFGIALVPAGSIYVKMRSGEAANSPTLTVETEGPPPADPLLIENVFVGENSLSIAGQNFDNGAMPTVSLSGVGNLTIDEFSATNIAASLPAGSLANGDYLLTVSTGTDAGQTNTFDLTIGAVGNQGPAGPQGPRGETGPAGPAGPMGAPGADGADGADGAAGPMGPAGVDGAVGETGPMGATGPVGPEGPAGPVGAPGADGAAGPVGPAGADGVAGAAGPMGLQGIQGIAGNDGAQGEAGPPGNTGPVGPEGPAGPQGPMGFPGPAGADGATGPMGLQGPQGIPGIPGMTGPAGPPGESGACTLSQCIANGSDDSNGLAELQCGAGSIVQIPCVIPPPATTVFVTAGLHTANLGGVAGGDAICQAEADAAELGGTYRAWLADGQTSPATDFFQSPGPYVRTDGTQIASDWAALVGTNISTTLDAPIDRLANGQQAQSAVGEWVWTGTSTSGTSLIRPGRGCFEWTSDDLTSPFPDAAVGQFSVSTRRWARWQDRSCELTARLYCFETQP